ncbi:unnamed protein product [Miscanthus lutarioriparius]|uniref:F-box domain-containing protein n=1 Tax=Miscanthus lutarioriparius TaxID=422564 RepID=A0A811Q7P4_9POAL|nr:unnamed protein product [Miscanthus lutarioriparius]
MEIAEGTRKRSRSIGGSSGGGDLDRLSALPDCLLHVILSSLRARQVVQTCVLSTRWRHLWRSVPCLDVDIVEFRRSGGGGGGGDSSSSDSDDDSSDSDIDTDSDSDYDSGYSRSKGKGLDIDRGRKPQFNRWSDGASHGSWTYSGRQAAAWLRRAMKYCTPGHAIINCQRQGLNLSPSSWHLRTLHLCHVPLDDRFAEHLSSVCRSLEDMELDHCACENRSIASDSLKNLVLKHCTWGRFFSDIACPKLKTLVINGGSNRYRHPPLAISAPMVGYLRLDVDADRFRGGISITKTMPSLDRASIHLRCNKYCLSKLRSRFDGDQSELLCSVSNATSLELSGVGTTVLGEEPKSLEFQNLRNLLLGDCDLSDDFRVLRFFHQGSPNLEKVTLRHCKFLGDSDSEDNEGKTRKLNKTSSSDCCGLDFLRDANVELEIIHKDDNDAC